VWAPLLSQDEPVGFHRGDVEPAPDLIRAGLAEHDSFPVLQLPPPGGFLRAVGGADPAIEKGSVLPKLERHPPPGGGEIERVRSEHHLGVRVLLVGVHPPPVQQPRRDRHPAHFAIFLRGPARQAFIRVACPKLNMTMAASST
jgi:hypothetical protein